MLVLVLRTTRRVKTLPSLNHLKQIEDLWSVTTGKANVTRWCAATNWSQWSSNGGVYRTRWRNSFTGWVTTIHSHLQTIWDKSIVILCLFDCIIVLFCVSCLWANKYSYLTAIYCLGVNRVFEWAIDNFKLIW